MYGLAVPGLRLSSFSWGFGALGRGCGEREREVEHTCGKARRERAGEIDREREKERERESGSEEYFDGKERDSHPKTGSKQHTQANGWR